MQSMHDSSDLNPDAPEFNMNMSDRKGEPRFQPPRHEYHERAEYQQQYQPNQQQQRRDSQQFLQDDQMQREQTMVREAGSEQPRQDDYRDRMDSTFSNDSLIQLTGDELAQREKEIFGEHYWQQQQEEKRRQEREQQPELQYEENFPAMQERQPEMSAPQPDMKTEARVPSFIPKGNLTSMASQPLRHRPISQYLRDLVLWRNTKDSAVIFSLGLFLLFSFAYFSFISVLAYAALSVLLLACGVVFGRQLMFALQQKEAAHPFERLLRQEVVIPPEYAHQQLDSLLIPVNQTLMRMRNLFLADSLGQSLKMALFVYMMTYVGRWFNLLTLCMLLWVAAFTMPRVYVMYRGQIDGVFRMARNAMEQMRLRVVAMIRRQPASLKAEVAAGDNLKVQKKVTIEKRQKIQ